jgi:hypothetical protein
MYLCVVWNVIVKVDVASMRVYNISLYFLYALVIAISVRAVLRESINRSALPHFSPLVFKKMYKPSQTVMTYDSAGSLTEL